jgi:hypothetical protein
MEFIWDVCRILSDEDVSTSLSALDLSSTLWIIWFTIPYRLLAPNERPDIPLRDDDLSLHCPRLDSNIVQAVLVPLDIEGLEVLEHLGALLDEGAERSAVVDVAGRGDEVGGETVNPRGHNGSCIPVLVSFYRHTAAKAVMRLTLDLWTPRVALCPPERTNDPPLVLDLNPLTPRVPQVNQPHEPVPLLQLPRLSRVGLVPHERVVQRRPLRQKVTHRRDGREVRHELTRRRLVESKVEVLRHILPLGTPDAVPLLASRVRVRCSRLRRLARQETDRLPPYLAPVQQHTLEEASLPESLVALGVTLDGIGFRALERLHELYLLLEVRLARQAGLPAGFRLVCGGGGGEGAEGEGGRGRGGWDVGGGDFFWTTWRVSGDTRG